MSPWLFLEGVAGVGPGQLSVNYGGYNLSQGYGLADIGLALGGGVALGPGVTLGARVRYDHVIAFGGLTGDANLWGISPTVGYRFTHSEGRYSYLQGGVGAEHSPKVGTVSLIVHLDYTFVAGHFLIGPGIDFLTNTQNGVKEEDFLFSLRVGYSAFR